MMWDVLRGCVGIRGVVFNECYNGSRVERGCWD